MHEQGPGNGRCALGDVINVLGKQSALLDLEKTIGKNKASHYDGPPFSGSNGMDSMKNPDKPGTHDSKGKAVFDSVPGFFDNTHDPKGKRVAQGAGEVCEIDSTMKEKFLRPSIFHGSRIRHMDAEVAHLSNPCLSLDLSGLNDKERESSVDLEGDCEEEEGEEDDMDREDVLTYASQAGMDHFRGRLDKLKANDGKCLTQEHTVRSGSQKMFGSLDFEVDGTVPCSNVQHAPVDNGALEEGGVTLTKSCTCPFCLKAAFMWTDLHYQDARGRLSALKKSTKLARLLAGKSYGNEYNVKAPGDNSNRAAEMEFDLAQQWRSLFLHSENNLVRETAQIHSNLLRLKELRESCKKDLQMISSYSLEK